MTPCIEGPFEITHVGILFGVDARIREKDGEVTTDELARMNHDMRTLVREYSMKNFILGVTPGPLGNP